MSDPTQLPAADPPDDTATALFQHEWQIYRKMVDQNYLFHREAYAALHRVLMEQAPRPFRFLDIACGDASAVATALTGTSIASYHGIDLSAFALAMAEQSLASLPCPVTLERRDFVDAMRERSEPADVVWIGLSLHHLLTPAKLALMRDVRRIIADDGLFVIYENSYREHEDRDGWLTRWDQQRPSWTAFTDDDWDQLHVHVHSADFGESPSHWRTLAREAGLAETRELFVSPTDLFRLYSFSPS